MTIELNDQDFAHVETLRAEFPAITFVSGDYTSADEDDLDAASEFYAVQSALARLRGEVDN